MGVLGESTTSSTSWCKTPGQGNTTSQHTRSCRSTFRWQTDLSRCANARSDSPHQ